MSLKSTESAKFVVNHKTGLLMPAEQRPSPNQDARPQSADIRMIVIHGISLPPGEYGGDNIDRLFTNKLDWDAHPYFAEIRGLRVSSHVLIRRDSTVVQFVPFTKRAWHAGESSFRGQSCCNDFSIGIELEGVDELPYAAVQYQQLVGVVRAIIDAYPSVGARHIAGHCDIAPGRKTDPGPAFDWLQLYDGLGTMAAKDGTT